MRCSPTTHRVIEIPLKKPVFSLLFQLGCLHSFLFSILLRYLDKPISDSGACDSASNRTNLTSTCNNNVDNSHELIVSSNPDIATDKSLSESRALVPVPETKLEPLAIVPANQKNKRPELSQRRVRRPFSVLEVEALVQAVEQLGTGR